jgi:hypothetical protein
MKRHAQKLKGREHGRDIQAERECSSEEIILSEVEMDYLVETTMSDSERAKVL